MATLEKPNYWYTRAFDNAPTEMGKNMERNIGNNIPESVELVYRLVGNTHVFSSKGIKGLVHVGSHDREKAFNDSIECLGRHVSFAYQCEAAYTCTMDYDQFTAHVDADNDIVGNFLTMTLASHASTCV
jgi:hypothetical protein